MDKARQPVLESIWSEILPDDANRVRSLDETVSTWPSLQAQLALDINTRILPSLTKTIDDIAQMKNLQKAFDKAKLEYESACSRAEGSLAKKTLVAERIHEAYQESFRLQLVYKDSLYVLYEELNKLQGQIQTDFVGLLLIWVSMLGSSCRNELRSIESVQPAVTFFHEWIIQTQEQFMQATIERATQQEEEAAVRQADKWTPIALLLTSSHMVEAVYTLSELVDADETLKNDVKNVIIPQIYQILEAYAQPTASVQPYLNGTTPESIDRSLLDGGAMQRVIAFLELHYTKICDWFHDRKEKDMIVRFSSALGAVQKTKKELVQATARPSTAPLLSRGADSSSSLTSTGQQPSSQGSYASPPRASLDNSQPSRPSVDSSSPSSSSSASSSSFGVPGPQPSTSSSFTPSSTTTSYHEPPPQDHSYPAATPPVRSPAFGSNAGPPPLVQRQRSVDASGRGVGMPGARGRGGIASPRGGGGIGGARAGAGARAGGRGMVSVRGAGAGAPSMQQRGRGIGARGGTPRGGAGGSRAGLVRPQVPAPVPVGRSPVPPPAPFLPTAQPQRPAPPPLAPAPPQPQVAQVLYDSAADSPAELSVSAGDMVNVLCREAEWCECELQSTGACGFIPTTYLEFF